MTFDEDFAKPGSKDIRYNREKINEDEYLLEHKFKSEKIRICLKSSQEFRGFQEFDSSEYNVVLISPNFDLELKRNPQKLNNGKLSSISKNLYNISKESLRILKPDGTLFIHHIPSVLPQVGHELNKKGLKFRYWISLRRPTKENYPIRHEHEGILMYFMDENNFHYSRIREPHEKCEVCGNYLSDWGGKKDQMNPEGSVISDIWNDVSFSGYEKNTKLPLKAVDRLLDLTTQNGFKVLLAPFEGDITNEKI